MKSRTARVVRREFAPLRRLAEMMWSPAHSAAAVDYVGESTVRGYFAHQWEAVMAS